MPRSRMIRDVQQMPEEAVRTPAALKHFRMRTVIFEPLVPTEALKVAGGLDSKMLTQCALKRAWRRFRCTMSGGIDKVHP